MKRWLEVLLLITAVPAMAQFASGPPGSLAFDQTGGIWGPLVSSSSMGAVSFTPPASALYCQFQGTATFTNSSASIAATNSFSAGAAVQFLTTGTLPTNFSTNSTYYVLTAGLSGSAFEVALTPLGTAVVAGSAGSGTQTVTASVPATSSCFGGGGTGNISGTVSATHLTMGTGADTVGDSPATFDGTTFVFPNPFSVQAHSAFGVGSTVDSVPTTLNSPFGGNTNPSAAISLFNESSTTAAGEVGQFTDLTWTPASTVAASYLPFASGIVFNVNLDSQSTATTNPLGQFIIVKSNGNTTGMDLLQGTTTYMEVNGTAPITEILGSTIFEKNFSSATIGSWLGLDVNMNNGGSGNGEVMAGASFTVGNRGTGAVSTLVGVSANLINGSTATITGDVDGFESGYNQAGGNPPDFFPYVATLTMSGGTFANFGMADFIADGGDSHITVTGTHAIPNLVGFDYEDVVAPAHVVNNDIGLLINAVTQGDNNWAIKTVGTALVELGGAVKLDGITGSGTAGVVQADASGNISQNAALANGTMATTQSQGDATANVATDPYVNTAITNALAGTNPAVAVLAASTGSNITGTYTQVGGGVGDTFTVTATGAFSLDGIAINTIGQRVLFKDQSTASQNGVYTATIVGTTGVSPVFTRALDYDTPADVNNTGAIPVQSGTVNATTSWLLTSQVTSIGSSGSSLVYAQFSYAPSMVALLASPTFTGTPAAPTAAVGTSTTQLGTTAFTLANTPQTTSSNTSNPVPNFTIETNICAMTIPANTFVGTQDASHSRLHYHASLETSGGSGSDVLFVGLNNTGLSTVPGHVTNTTTATTGNRPYTFDMYCWMTGASTVLCTASAQYGSAAVTSNPVTFSSYPVSSPIYVSVSATQTASTDTVTCNSNAFTVY